MIALTDAIVARFNASDSLRAFLPGGIHQDQAPVGVSWDYLTFKAVTFPTTPVYGGASLGKLLVQFSVWTLNGASRAGVIAAAIIEAFATVFPLSAGGLTNAVLNNTPVPRQQMKKSPDGSLVVMCPVEIVYSFELG